MERRGIAWRGVLVLTIAATLTACGKDTGTNPDGNGGSGSGGSGGSGSSNCSVPVSVLGCPKGLIRATLDGQTFNGGITNGGAIYTPVAPIPSLNLPAQDFVVLVGITSTGSQLALTMRAKVGTSAIGAGVIDSETRNVSVNSAGLVVPATGGASVGAGWLTSVAGGSGTLTVTSVSTTSVAGSFAITMVPTPNTGASGNRSMTGTFTATF